MRSCLTHALTVLATTASAAWGPTLHAQRPAPAERSAPVSNLQYEVAFTRVGARTRTLHVTTRLSTAGKEPVLLSLPAWTPGAYELSYFARQVLDFRVTGDGKARRWDKLDFDTWRIHPEGARELTIEFDYRADSLDNAMAWSRDDFAFFNGTNVFLYPEGRELTFGASVAIRTEPEWKVATGMPTAGTPTSAPRSFAARNYHELVDMPFFVGAFDVDSQQVQGRWVRLASYPSGGLAGAARSTFWNEVQRMIPPMADAMGDVPFERYTILTVFDSSSAGGSALEHANSHLGIYTPYIIGNTALPSITAHEIFHAWNVKLLRPADMVPYRYDRAQPTPWLWVSEGITDYYADLALVRGGIVDSTGFVGMTNAKIEEIAQLPPVALEDASLSTWVHPVDGTAYIYYPKGSLAGFMLDVLIRDATDNAAGLDQVMRELYRTTAKAGRGFTAQEWWSTVTRVARGKSFTDFNARYIDGREPFPWGTVLPLAGLKVRVDSMREPRIGVLTAMDSTGRGVVVTDVEPGGAAEAAGVRAGDGLVSIGDIPVSEGFGPRFRARYGRADGQAIPVKVLRGGRELTLQLTVRMEVSTSQRIVFDASASPRARRVRRGILTGRVDP